MIGFCRIDVAQPQVLVRMSLPSFQASALANGLSG
jgi:hypothetical protein